MPEFRRTKIRLPADNYRGQRRYFVTLCFHRRRKFGADPRIALAIIDQLRKHTLACLFAVLAYCVMPDHIHFLARGESEASYLIKFIESFKQETGEEFARRGGGALWQTNYYDHILRERDGVERVAWYIWLNPVRQGLCAAPADYPFSGAMTPAMAELFRGSSKVQWTPPWKSVARIKQTKTEIQNLPG
jgi:REP element-mobilizing transposase RayT